ncbi:MAG: hypothetical protein QOK07_2268 [Gemmatimonadaceae bacterium]|nr:hypothetical protein [Gemmatimonadaceae bacterium]
MTVIANDHKMGPLSANYLQRKDDFVASVTAVGLIAVSITAATLGAKSHIVTPSHIASARSIPSAPAAKAPVVTVTGADFTFDAPETIPAGVTEFRFLNKGPSIHHMQILKLLAGKTFEDLRAALANPGPPPAWIKMLGGPNAPVPGTESNATLTLAPGNYAIICFVDLGGPPHFTKGMIRPLKVVPSKVASVTTPKADITTTLFDYNFKLSSHVRAGTHTMRVHNTGPQTHEVELVQLAPGKTAEDFVAWLGNMKGPPPGKPIGGIAAIEPGMSQLFTADFAPGNYALVCFIPDSKDGKPHYAHGMTKQFNVS